MAHPNAHMIRSWAYIEGVEEADQKMPSSNPYMGKAGEDWQAGFDARLAEIEEEKEDEANV